ncbi:hypothetical protein [Carp edema virus]|nr:hypothetical protein [Carp edema virus]
MSGVLVITTKTSQDGPEEKRTVFFNEIEVPQDIIVEQTDDSVMYVKLQYTMFGYGAVVFTVRFLTSSGEITQSHTVDPSAELGFVKYVLGPSESTFNIIADYVGEDVDARELDYQCLEETAEEAFKANVEHCSTLENLQREEFEELCEQTPTPEEEQSVDEIDYSYTGYAGEYAVGGEYQYESEE